MSIGWLEFSRAMDDAKMLRFWQILLLLTDIFKDDMNPEKFFTCRWLSCRTVGDPLVEEQAVKTNSPINRIPGVIFMGSIGYPSNFNTYGRLLPFL